MVPLRVKVPAPAVVRIAALAPSAITPVIEEAEVLVTLIVPWTVMLAALSTPVVIVVLPSAVELPTAPVKVTLPEPAAMVSASPALAALVVPLKVTLLLVVVSVRSPVMVTLPV